jgi:ankyrin repeat protein
VDFGPYWSEHHKKDNIRVKETLWNLQYMFLKSARNAVLEAGAAIRGRVNPDIWKIESKHAEGPEDSAAASADLQPSSDVADTHDVFCFWHVTVLAERELGKGAEVVKLLRKEADPKLGGTRDFPATATELLKFVKITGPGGRTPMQFAVQCEHFSVNFVWKKRGRLSSSSFFFDLCKYKLNPFIDKNFANKDGMSPIHWACGRAQADVVRALKADKWAEIPTEFDALTKQTATQAGLSPLMVACRDGAHECLRELLKKDGAIDDGPINPESTRPLKEQYGMTGEVFCPLPSQVLCDNLIAGCLICVFFGFFFGETGLHYAAYQSHAGCVEVLIEADHQNLDRKEPNADYTALMVAADRNNAFICELLLDARANPTIKTKSGLTAAKIAMAQNNAGLVKLILGAVDVWAQRGMPLSLIDCTAV